MNRLYLLAMVLAVTLHALAFAATPALIGPTCDEVGRLEVNAYYDLDGKLVFRQLIGWDYWPEQNVWHVRFWRMAKTGDLIPRRDWLHGGYVVLFDDNGVLRKIRAASFDESHTQHDPEADDREAFAVEKRKELAKR